MTHMKKSISKLKLETIKVHSFVTEFKNKRLQTIKGGEYAPTGPRCVAASDNCAPATTETSESHVENCTLQLDCAE